MQVFTGDIDKGKRLTDIVDIADPERQIVFNVPEQVQVPPQIIPPQGPSPAGRPPTTPQTYAEATSFCGNKALLGIGLRPEWVTTTPQSAIQTQLQLVEGRVYDSFVARIDTPRGHLDNDADVKIDVDPW